MCLLDGSLFAVGVGRGGNVGEVAGPGVVIRVEELLGTRLADILDAVGVEPWDGVNGGKPNCGKVAPVGQNADEEQEEVCEHCRLSVSFSTEVKHDITHG